MGQFKPMVKMMTDEPKVILKLKKGGKVASKVEEMCHKPMDSSSFESEPGKSPKKPSMMARVKAMNPNQYKKGGDVAKKGMGGGMSMAAPMSQLAPMQPMGQAALGQMNPMQRKARAMAVRKALTGMKKGGSADHKMIMKLEKELHHHESMPMSKAHHKASGGAIDKDETKTTIKGNAKKFAKTFVVDGDHADKAHGTGEVKESNAGSYKRGGHAHKMHHRATGGAIPSDTHEKKNPGKYVQDTIEGNEHDYLETEMHSAKKDKAHGTGGVSMSNAGGYKRGGMAHKMHHKASGGQIEREETRTTVKGGNWENRAADTAKPGKRNTKTGEVKEANAGGYKHGGHASKKAYATGGNVVDNGKAVKMPHHFVSQPVANSLQSGTFKRGGKVK